MQRVFKPLNVPRRIFDIQGHRGARGLFPENTLPAFLEAVRVGADTIELDLVLSRDGHLVVSHEPWFSHMYCSTPDGAPISEAEEKSHNLYEMSLEQLQRYDCGVRRHPHFGTQATAAAHKPSLAQVVAAVDEACSATRRRPMRYNLEVKSEPEWVGVFQPTVEVLADHVLEAVDALDLAQRAGVQSFDGNFLNAAHDRNPELEYGLLVQNNLTFPKNLARLRFQPRVYSPYFSFVRTTLVTEAHGRSMLVIPWTLNDTNFMKSMAAMDCDGLITDFPNMAVEVFSASDSGGLW